MTTHSEEKAILSEAKKSQYTNSIQYTLYRNCILNATRIGWKQTPNHKRPGSAIWIANKVNFKTSSTKDKEIFHNDKWNSLKKYIIFLSVHATYNRA